MAKDHALGDLVNVDDVEEDFEVEGQVVSLGQAVLSGQAKHHKKVRAHFGRKRTHNEQIIVAPCGIIISCEMFYGAKGVGSVVVSHLCDYHCLDSL
jgi:hypothetical protein